MFIYFHLTNSLRILEGYEPSNAAFCPEYISIILTGTSHQSNASYDLQRGIKQSPSQYLNPVERADPKAQFQQLYPSSNSYSCHRN